MKLIGGGPEYEEFNIKTSKRHKKLKSNKTLNKTGDKTDHKKTDHKKTDHKKTDHKKTDKNNTSRLSHTSYSQRQRQKQARRTRNKTRNKTYNFAQRENLTKHKKNLRFLRFNFRKLLKSATPRTI